MKTVLLTGGSGFIGRHTLQPLINRGYLIHAFSTQPQDEQEGVIWHLVDLANYEAVHRAMIQIQPSHLLHMAWKIPPGSFWNDKINLNWVEIGIRLVESFAKINFPGRRGRVVIAGSCAEYAWDNNPLSETKGKFNPATLYGACKRQLFEKVRIASSKFNFSFAWGYIFHLFGIGENKDRFIPKVITSLLLNLKLDCSDGWQRRDFSDVRDVARAFVELLDSPVEGGINIASGNLISLRSLVDEIVNFTGYNGSINWGARAQAVDEPMELKADTSRLRQLLSWTPHFSISQSVSETVEWWKTQLL